MLLIIQILAAGVIVLFVAVVQEGPVPRGRVVRFARRQRLTVTAGNGNQIITYLATTRRWRCAGVVAGILAPTLWAQSPLVALNVVSAQALVFALNPLTIFAGWFAGAVLAEARVARRGIVAQASGVRPALGVRRAASLWARRPSAYLSRFSWWLLPAAATLCVVMAGATAVLARSGLVHPDWTAVAALLVAVGVAVVVRLTQLRVLRRSQPYAEPDVIAGDDAIRSRSLHVLAGGGAALVLCCVLWQLAALNLTYGESLFQAMMVARGFGWLLIPALGWNVGTWAWRVRRDPAGFASPA